MKKFWNNVYGALIHVICKNLIMQYKMLYFMYKNIIIKQIVIDNISKSYYIYFLYLCSIK